MFANVLLMFYDISHTFTIVDDSLGPRTSNDRIFEPCSSSMMPSPAFH